MKYKTRTTAILPLISLACVSSLLQAPVPEKQVGQVLGVRHFEIPQYDPIARRILLKGDVQLRLRIGADGSVQDVLRVAGPRLLSDPSVRAVKLWTFALRSPEPSELQLTFRFSLTGKESEEIKTYTVSGDFPEIVTISTNPPQTSWPNHRGPT